MTTPIQFAPQFITPTDDGRIFVSVTPAVMTTEAVEALAERLLQAVAVAQGGLVTARTIQRG